MANQYQATICREIRGILGNIYPKNQACYQYAKFLLLSNCLSATVHIIRHIHN